MLVNARTYQALQLLAETPLSPMVLAKRMKCRKQTACAICQQMSRRGYLEKRPGGTSPLSGQRISVYHMPDPSRLAELTVGSTLELRRAGFQASSLVAPEQAQDKPFVSRTVVAWGIELETVPIPGSRHLGASSLVGTSGWGCA